MGDRWVLVSGGTGRQLEIQVRTDQEGGSQLIYSPSFLPSSNSVYV
jgi:hypothetical protein